MSAAQTTIMVSKPTIIGGEWHETPTLIYREGNRIVRETFLAPVKQTRHA